MNEGAVGMNSAASHSADRVRLLLNLLPVKNLPTYMYTRNGLVFMDIQMKFLNLEPTVSLPTDQLGGVSSATCMNYNKNIRNVAS